jgi:hypothetical protein
VADPGVNPEIRFGHAGTLEFSGRLKDARATLDREYSSDSALLAHHPEVYLCNNYIGTTANGGFAENVDNTDF